MSTFAENAETSFLKSGNRAKMIDPWELGHSTCVA